MKLYFCEHSSKGNHYVVATNIVHAIKLFSKNVTQDPEKVTVADNNVIMDTTLSIHKETV